MPDNKLVIVIEDDSPPPSGQATAPPMPGPFQGQWRPQQTFAAAPPIPLHAQTALGGMHQQSRLADSTLSIQRQMEQQRRQPRLPGDLQQQQEPLLALSRIMEERRQKVWREQEEAKLKAQFPSGKDREATLAEQRRQEEQRRRDIMLKLGAAGTISGMVDSGTISGILGQGVAGGLAGEALAGTKGAAVGAIVGATLAGAKMITAAVKEQSGRIAMFSPIGARAQAEANVTAILGDIRRGREHGPDIARFITAQSRLDQSWEDFKVKLLPLATQMVELLTVLAKPAQTAFSLIEWLWNGITGGPFTIIDWIFDTKLSPITRALDENAKNTTFIKDVMASILRAMGFTNNLSADFLEQAMQQLPGPQRGPGEPWPPRSPLFQGLP